MADGHFIAPFPDDIDSDRFGDWLSGFVDGEGCFYLTLRQERALAGRRPTARISFLLGVRADDLPILQLIQSYFGCGIITYYDRPDRVNGMPSCQFRVDRIGHLYNILVPHFVKHPLRAKKARDFLIWKQAVEYLYQAVGRRYKVRGGGSLKRLPKWTDEELTMFESFVTAIRLQRQYDTAGQVMPAANRHTPQSGLFDDMP